MTEGANVTPRSENEIHIDIGDKLVYDTNQSAPDGTQAKTLYIMYSTVSSGVRAMFPLNSNTASRVPTGPNA